MIKRTVSVLTIVFLFGCIGSRPDAPVVRAGSVDGTKYKSVENKIKDLEQELGARVGVSLYDVETKESWNYKGDTRFPLMSTFKTLACAKALLDVENKRVSFDASVLVQEKSLITWSPVTKNHVGRKFSLKEACAAMMVMSDNTAANIVLEKIGDPNALTSFMRTMCNGITI